MAENDFVEYQTAVVASLVSDYDVDEEEARKMLKELHHVVRDFYDQMEGPEDCAEVLANQP